MTFVTGAVALALLLGVIYGFGGNAWDLILKPSNGFEAKPVLVKATWAATATLFLAFGALVLVHAKIREQFEQFQLDAQTYQQRRATELVNDLGYKEFDSIEVPVSDAKYNSLRLFAKPEVTIENNMVQQEVLLLDTTTKGESSFIYSVLLQNRSWMLGSETRLQGDREEGLALSEAVLDPYLKRGVEKAPYVYCIGLASNELGNLSNEDNEKLSDARATNLCIALLNAKIVVQGPQTIVPLGAGFATQAAAAVADPNRQRAAIIIGVKHTSREFTVSEFVLSMNKLMRVPGVNLERYSRKPAQFVPGTNILPGKYIKFTEIEWSKRNSDALVPVIPAVAAQPRQP